MLPITLNRNSQSSVTLYMMCLVKTAKPSSTRLVLQRLCFNLPTETVLETDATSIYSSI